MASQLACEDPRDVAPHVRTWPHDLHLGKARNGKGREAGGAAGTLVSYDDIVAVAWNIVECCHLHHHRVDAVLPLR